MVSLKIKHIKQIKIMKLIEKSIFKKAGKLTRRGFTELNATNKITECDALVVSETKKTFWLTTKDNFNLASFYAQ